MVALAAAEAVVFVVERAFFCLVEPFAVHKGSVKKGACAVSMQGATYCVPTSEPFHSQAQSLDSPYYLLPNISKRNTSENLLVHHHVENFQLPYYMHFHMFTS